MKYNSLAVAFILLVVVIIITKSLADAALIMSLLVYVFILSSNANKLWRKESLEEKPAEPAKAPTEPPQITKPRETPPSGQSDLYGPDFAQHYAYTDVGKTGWTGSNSPQAFGTVYSAHVDIPHGTTLGVDQATVELARRRARDRQAIEGASVKDVNYYRYHFAGELDEAEKRQWWGNQEY